MSLTEPTLAVILATDIFATIRFVVEQWRRQTMRHRVELVLVAPSADSVREALSLGDEFYRSVFVENPVTDFAAARVAGIQACSAPFVFIAETHAYPRDENFVQEIVAAFSNTCSWVVPAFGNANSTGVLSWSGFFTDYGRWSDGLPTGKFPDAPIFNCAYRREVLLEFGDRLAPALSQGDELAVTLHARGHCIFMQSEARLDHANVSAPLDWFKERFWTGLMIGSFRAKRWSGVRRLAYVAGSPLIPAVMLRRMLPGILRTAKRLRVPAMTIPTVIVGILIRTFGEVMGYLGFPAGRAIREMHEYELHKFNYTGKWRP